MAVRTSFSPRARAKKPIDLPIKARRLDFVFDASLPRYWYYDDPFLTHFMHALSLTFPDGERLFMDAVRALEGACGGPRDARRHPRLPGQEALHARAHEALNELLSARGYPVATPARGDARGDQRAAAHTGQAEPAGDDLRARAHHRDHGSSPAVEPRVARAHAGGDAPPVALARAGGDRAQVGRLRRVPGGLRRPAHAAQVARTEHARLDEHGAALSGRARSRTTASRRALRSGSRACGGCGGRAASCRRSCPFGWPTSSPTSIPGKSTIAT